MRRYLIFAYGLVAYAVSSAVMLYLAGFLCNIAVPKGIDSGAEPKLAWAIAVNAALVGLLALQHTVMARPWFKTWWTKIVPQPAERSTFVLATSLIFLLLFWQWRPMPAVVWSVASSVAYWTLMALFLGGMLVVLYGSMLIDHFDLLGLRQVYLHLRGREYTDPTFSARSLYRYVRHPLMLGFLIAAWATPTMTAGHLLFSSLLSIYVFIGIQFEERDLLRTLGDDYREYRERTAMLLPLRKRLKQTASS